MIWLLVHVEFVITTSEKRPAHLTRQKQQGHQQLEVRVLCDSHESKKT